MAVQRLISDARSRIAKGQHDERGFTLVEVMTAMFIFAIFSAMVLAVVSSMLNTSNRATQRFNNVDDVRTVMAVLVRDIRAASTSNGEPVSVATGSTMTFYSALGASGGPTLVTFALTGTTLTRTITPGPNYTAPPATSVMSTHIVSPQSGANALFTYSAITGTTTSSPDAVAKVTINLVDNASTLAPAAATLHNEVWMRNVQYANS